MREDEVGGWVGFGDDELITFFKKLEKDHTFYNDRNHSQSVYRALFYKKCLPNGTEKSKILLQESESLSERRQSFVS